jgi:hypothetical protein
MRRARCAEQARGAMGADGNDTGGKDERLREHRIGHFRLQACGGCDCDARIAFATAFTLGDIRICWDGCWCDGGKADLEG